MAMDRCKRAVSLVTLSNSGRLVNREMIAEGWAWAYRTYLGRPYKSEFIGLEDAARMAGKGLWKQSNPRPPWDFRRRYSVEYDKSMFDADCLHKAYVAA